MYTAFDVIEYLLATAGGGAQDQEHRVLRQALFHAYRDLISVREWRWYHTVEQVPLSTTNLVTTHVLPWGAQSVDSVHMGNPPMVAEYLTPVEWERLVRSWNKELTRFVWTVAPSSFSPDRYEIRILNGWRYQEDVTLTYRRRPRDLRLTGWEPSSRAGTVSWANGEVTGTGTAFTNHMVGSVLRVSGDPTWHPESLAGMRPYKDEALIRQVPNSTKLTVWSPIDGIAYTGTKYVVTDYLDLAPGMYSALLSGAEVWAARLLGKNIEGSTGVYGRDLRLAFENDAVAPLSGRRGSNGWYSSFWYLRPGSDQGTGGGGMGGPNEDGVCPLLPDVYGGESNSQYDSCGGMP
jgi:hypothetical protein